MSRTSNDRLLRAIAICLGLFGFGLLGPSCDDRFSADDPPPPPAAAPTEGIGDEGVGSISQIEVEYPLFEGIRSMLPGDGTIRLSWDPASDNNDAPEDIFYRAYLAAGPGDQVFTAPSAETAPGETAVEFTGLPNTVIVFAVVRAVDTEGNEDPNTSEWFAIPNPVFYVSQTPLTPAPNPLPAIGTSPFNPFPSLGAATGLTIGPPGANIYVAEGVYQENVIIFPGRFFFGGFDSNFDIETRDPVVNLTEIAIPPEDPSNPSPQFDNVDLVVLRALSADDEPDVPAGVDGFQINGNQRGQNGVRVAEAGCRVTNNGIRNLEAHGIEISPLFIDDYLIEGFVRNNSIVDNLAEGILIDGLVDIAIDSNLIRNNGNEGIEAQFIRGATDIDTRIDVTRNVIEGNGDEGIDLDIGEINELLPAESQGARIRALIRNNRIERNATIGVQIDVDFENSDGIDFRCRIEDNAIRGHALEGVSLDGDARCSFRLARNIITANRGAAIAMNGAVNGPTLRLLNSRIIGNGAGIEVTGHAATEVRGCLISENRGAAFTGIRSYIDVVDSIVIGNALTSQVTSVRSSIFRTPERPTGLLGEGLQDVDPDLENQPALVTTALGSAGAAILLADTSPWSVGNVAELSDDGVAREVTAVTGDRIFLDPPASNVVAGEVVFGFPTGSIVLESEVPNPGSPAIDAGDPFETDRADGTIADLGPAGGDTPGNVGIETAIPPESAPVELVSASPTVGYAQTGGTFECTFNRVLPPGFDGSAELRLNGVLVPATIARIDRMLMISTTTVPDPGDTWRVELFPFEGNSESERQTGHVIWEWTAADSATDSDALAISNDTLATAQSVTGSAVLVAGAIDSPTDVDTYELNVPAGSVVEAEVVAGQVESPLASRVTIRNSAGGILASTASNIPFVLDPVATILNSPTTVFVQIESSDGLGSAAHVYDLFITVRPQ